MEMEIMLMILLTRGCFRILLDLLLDTILNNMGHTLHHLGHTLPMGTPHKPIHQRDILLQVHTHRLDILIQVDTRPLDILPMADTRQLDILLQVDIPVILLHQLHIMQGTDQIWEHC